MKAVFYVLIILYVFVTALIAQVFFFRFLFAQRDKNKADALNIWMPVLAETTLQIPDSIPPLQQKHLNTFLYQWNKTHMIVRGEATARLIELARHLKLENYAHKMLGSRSVPTKMLAIITLGNMKDQSAWKVLMDILHSNNLILSLTAARALTQIDHKNAIQDILPEVIHQREWPTPHVSSILKKTDPILLCNVMGQAIRQANENDLPHLINLTIGNTHCDTIGMAILEILQKSTNTQVIAACLQSIDDYRGIAYARHYATHPQGYVRVHAANALGRIGRKDDIELLVSMLSDKEWWVRYRAAQALTSMPFLRIENIEALQNRLQDKFAKDILTQALEERRQV